jgi:hypothetical protein
VSRRVANSPCRYINPSSQYIQGKDSSHYHNPLYALSSYTPLLGYIAEQRRQRKDTPTRSIYHTTHPCLIGTHHFWHDDGRLCTHCKKNHNAAPAQFAARHGRNNTWAWASCNANPDIPFAHAAYYNMRKIAHWLQNSLYTTLRSYTKEEAGRLDVFCLFLRAGTAS